MHITKKAITIVNDLVLDVFDRLAREASTLARRNIKINQEWANVTDSEFESAIRLMIPGELRQNAIAQGRKAIEDYKKASKILNYPTK